MWVLWTTLALAASQPALDALDEGDEAWFSGERRAGVRAWRRSLDLTDEHPDGRAVEAMVRLRLIRAGSTFAPLWHGPRHDDALEACGSGPWCALALADFHLFAPPEVGADPDRGLELIEQVEAWAPERAASRRAWISGDLDPVLAIEPDQRDGLGRAMAAGLAREPGPWVLGVGLVAGHATGWGAAVHLDHPDLFRRAVRGSLDGFLATGAAGVGGLLETSGRVGLTLSGHLARSRWWDGAQWVAVDTASARPGAVVRLGRLAARAGPLARWDQDEDEVSAGHGAWASMRLDGRRWLGGRPQGAWLGLGGELAAPPVADYARQGGWVDARAYRRVWRGVLAGRIRFEGAAGEMPEVRLPTVGGSHVFRGARPGALRGPWTGVAGVELRHPLWGPLWGAAFAGGAVVGGQGSHPGGGVGLRWVLPPHRRNTVRVDLGVTDVGVEVVVAHGEAF